MSAHRQIAPILHCSKETKGEIRIHNPKQRPSLMSLGSGVATATMLVLNCVECGSTLTLLRDILREFCKPSILELILFIQHEPGIILSALHVFFSVILTTVLQTRQYLHLPFTDEETIIEGLSNMPPVTDKRRMGLEIKVRQSESSALNSCAVQSVGNEHTLRLEYQSNSTLTSCLMCSFTPASRPT